MIKWTLETKKISILKCYSKNPRFIRKDDLKQLMTSIDKFGLIDKPIINLDNTIIGGHQRINVLRMANEKSVECWIPDHQLDDKEVEELNVRLNRNTGEWDFEILANAWNVDELVDWGFKIEEFGITNAEEIAEKEPKEQDKDKTISCPSCGHEFVK
jgi:ParB-like chromosome segregation protein Spo0J